MNSEMLKIYREMLESGNLEQEEINAIKKDLEEEKTKIKKELDKFYDDGGMLKHSSEIANRENSGDEINELLDEINQISPGRDFPKKQKEETLEEPKIDETKSYAEDENQELVEDDQPEEIGEKINVPKEAENFIEETTIEIADIPEEKFKKEAMEVIDGREDLENLSEVMAKGERSARLVMEKIGGSEEHEVEQEPDKDKSHDYDKDERTR